jgi:hypothetical protein
MFPPNGMAQRRADRAIPARPSNTIIAQHILGRTQAARPLEPAFGGPLAYEEATHIGGMGDQCVLVNLLGGTEDS